mgnify:FL=1
MWGIHATIKGTFLAFILELIVDFLFILIGIIFVILIAIFFLVTENLLLFVFKNVFASERLFSSALKRLVIISKSVLSNIVLIAVFTYPHYREFTDSQFISIALQIADKFIGTDKQDAAEGLLAEAFKKATRRRNKTETAKIAVRWGLYCLSGRMSRKLNLW